MSYKKLSGDQRAINSILRRLNKYHQLKVSFSDFSESITPVASDLLLGKLDPINNGFVSDFPISPANRIIQNEALKDVFATSPFRTKNKKEKPRKPF